jgi:hypothetical protein
MDKKDILKRFTKKLILQFFIIASISAAVFYFWVPQHYFQFLPIVFLYFFVLNLTVYNLLLKAHDLSTAKFSQYFLIITSLKFFGSIIFVVTYMIFAKHTVIPFLVIFIILYFSSLIQVVREFLSFIKEKSLK